MKRAMTVFGWFNSMQNHPSAQKTKRAAVERGPFSSQDKRETLVAENQLVLVGEGDAFERLAMRLEDGIGLARGRDQLIARTGQRPLGEVRAGGAIGRLGQAAVGGDGDVARSLGADRE